MNKSEAITAMGAVGDIARQRMSSDDLKVVLDTLMDCKRSGSTPRILGVYDWVTRMRQEIWGHADAD